jgi:molybdate transport system regulatory protein
MFTGHTEFCYRETGGGTIIRNIVVAAAGRKLGKTLFCTGLIEALCNGGFSVAYYKLKKQAGGRTEILAGPGRKNSDTWRNYRAGAVETVLVKYSSENDLEGRFPVSTEKLDVAVWETNSAAHLIHDSTVVYIDGHAGAEEPKNPELVFTADVLIDGPLGTAPQETIGLTLSVAGIAGFNPVYPGWKLWLECGGNPVFGGGVASLLEAIRDSGSILSASKFTGIQYRRVWTLVSNTEQKLGVKLIRRSRGGSGGGGSSLTSVAVLLLKRYHFLEEAMADAAKRLEENN